MTAINDDSDANECDQWEDWPNAVDIGMFALACCACAVGAFVGSVVLFTALGVK